jgi:hypothetical protein
MPNTKRTPDITTPSTDPLPQGAAANGTGQVPQPPGPPKPKGSEKIDPTGTIDDRGWP